MKINDLLVSYNQVQVPQFMQEPIIDYKPIGDELINQENLERIKSRKKEGFAGWKPLEQLDNSQQYSNTISNMTPSKGNATFEKAMDSYLAKHPEDAQYRQTLTKIAEKESSFRPTVTSKYSSACGYFGFINSTRKQYAPNLTREQVDYGMWFSPGEFAKYLKTGKSDFKDSQGTSLMTILKKMA